MLHDAIERVKMLLGDLQMDSKKPTKASKADEVRTETITFRLGKRLRALAEVGALSKGVKLAHYVETSVEAALAQPLNDALMLPLGSSVLEFADELYDDDDATCFLKRVHRYSWALSTEQHKILRLIQSSAVLNPSKGHYNGELIRQHWEALSEASTSGDVSALPSKMFSGADFEFALMSETERMALYRRSPEEFTNRSQAHIKAMKGRKTK